MQLHPINGQAINPNNQSLNPAMVGATLNICNKNSEFNNNKFRNQKEECK